MDGFVAAATAAAATAAAGAAGVLCFVLFPQSTDCFSRMDADEQGVVVRKCFGRERERVSKWEEEEAGGKDFCRVVWRGERE